MRSTGQLSGIAATPGDYAVTITVDDGVDGTDSTSFTWRVFDPNFSPGVAYEYYEASFDSLPDFDALTPVDNRRHQQLRPVAGRCG